MKKIKIMIGIILCSIFFFFLILYLNLFIIGYTFLKFAHFIIRQFWFYLLPIGLLLIILGLRKDE